MLECIQHGASGSLHLGSSPSSRALNRTGGLELLVGVLPNATHFNAGHSRASWREQQGHRSGYPHALGLRRVTWYLELAKRNPAFLFMSMDKQLVLIEGRSCVRVTHIHTHTSAQLRVSSKETCASSYRTEGAAHVGNDTAATRGRARVQLGRFS